MSKNTLGEYQVGFKPNRFTIDHLFTICQLLEKSWKYNNPLHQLFMDFKKAYDSLMRGKWWDAKAELAIPGKVI